MNSDSLSSLIPLQRGTLLPFNSSEILQRFLQGVLLLKKEETEEVKNPADRLKRPDGFSLLYQQTKKAGITSCPFLN
tara:strand:- start:22913 stop:23143 length:231 start_codon:yes stop_codon:yes gene_type:complete